MKYGVKLKEELLMAMPWPVYFKDRLIIGNRSSDTAIATLWTPMNVVAERVDIEKLSVIGQLYTKQGINYLFRNILLNPRITRLMLTGADLMGSGEALLRLVKKGSSSKGSSLLGLSLPSGAVRDFCRNVKISNQIGPVSPNKVKTFVNKSSEGKLWAKSKKFAEPGRSSLANSLPSEETLFIARGDKIWQTWIRLLHQIMRFGRSSPMIHHYGGERITELINLSAVVYQENPHKPELPGWLPFSRKDVERYIESFLKASRGKETYSYGERLKSFPLEGYKLSFLNQIDDQDKFRRSLKKALSNRKLNQQRLIVKKLKTFPENKGALAVLWEPIIDNFGLRKTWHTPCLVLVQAIIRDKRLFLTGYFRSNDIYGSWPLNVFGLRAFQQELVRMVDKKLKLGPLATISHSAHIYESSWQPAGKLVRDHWKKVACEWDKRGNLAIEVTGKDIVVKHLSPEGKFIEEYQTDGTKKKAARDLCFKLESAGVFGTVGNAMYAARQIERAETAIKLGLSFSSDEPLKLRGP